MLLEQWDMHMQKKKKETKSHLSPKLTQNGQLTNLKCKTIKCLENNTGGNLEYLGLTMTL